MADDQSPVETVNVSGVVEDVPLTELCEAENKAMNSKRQGIWTLPQSASSMDLRDVHLKELFFPNFQVRIDNFNGLSYASRLEKRPKTVSPHTTFPKETVDFSVDPDNRRGQLFNREFRSFSFEDKIKRSGLWTKPLSRTASREHTSFPRQESVAERTTDRIMPVNPIDQERQSIIAEHIQDFWLQWISDAFPDLLHCAHFNPSFFVNSVSGIKQSSFLEKKSEIVSSFTSLHDFSHPSPIRYNKVRGDKALQKVLYSLQKMSEQKQEVLFVVSQLPFRRHLGETCYSATAEYVHSYHSLLVALHQTWEEGDFDVLILHPLYGLVVCVVMVCADEVTTPDISIQDTASKIRSKLEEAVSQLNRAEAMLLFLVSDITPGLRIRKTIAFPNLSADQIQSAITRNNQLIEDLCLCLGGKDLSDVTGLCLCSDQLSDPETQKDVSKELRKWWVRRVAAYGSESNMTFERYQKLVSRFCGSASTVTILCISPPRLGIKATNQASSRMSKNYNVQITLFPEQVHLLNMAPHKVFLAGPPGTGKSVMLQLMATEWLRCESSVLIVGTGYGSHAACYKLHHLLQHTIKQLFVNEGALSRLHIMLYDFTNDDDVKKAVSDLLQVAKGESLYIIVDEIGPCDGAHFMALCGKLLTHVPCLHLWAASYYHEFVPFGWQLEYFTRPLRYTSAVLKEVKFHRDITMHKVQGYDHCCEFNSTDCSPVYRLYHRHQDHKTLLIKDCEMCGRAVADVLFSLLASSDMNLQTRISLFNDPQYRDVLILSSEDLRDDMGLVMGLKNAGIPVRVMTDDDTEDVATARSDIVWVASGNRARGLERKVVVVHDECSQYQLHTISRCTSKLVVVTNMDPPSAYDEYQQGEMAINKSQSSESKVSEEITCRPTCSNETDCAEIQRNSSIPPPPLCHSTSYKITVDLTKAISLETQDHNIDPLARCSSDTGSRTGEATENSNENVPSPMFNKHWQDRVSLSAEGGRLQKQGSDVVLQVPAGAIEVDTKVTVRTAICSKEVYIKHKLQLPARETIVSPLVEFWAGPDFHFQKHVEITLPTCLPSDYDINLLHVYCVTNEQTNGQMNVTKMERQLSELPDDESPSAYFYVNDRQIHMMTSHFSGYVCTYCGLCQDIGLEVYAAHTRENGSLNVSIIAHFWDKLHLQDFREWKPELNSYTTVLSTTFQLTTIMMPAVLQVDFIIDEEQSELWKLKETRVPTKRFFLNWSKIDCEHSLEHQAVKYTNLGPFSPGWKVTNKQNENEMRPSKLDAYILVSHVEKEAVVPQWTSAQYQIDVQRSADVKSMTNNVTINNFIQNVKTLHIAQQSEDNKAECGEHLNP